MTEDLAADGGDLTLPIGPLFCLERWIGLADWRASLVNKFGESVEGTLELALDGGLVVPDLVDIDGQGGTAVLHLIGGRLGQATPDQDPEQSDLALDAIHIDQGGQTGTLLRREAWRVESVEGSVSWPHRLTLSPAFIRFALSSHAFRFTMKNRGTLASDNSRGTGDRRYQNICSIPYYI